MKFGNLNYLLLLWTLPIIAFFYVYAYRKKIAALKRFATPKLLSQLNGLPSGTRYLYKGILLGLGLLFLVFALIQPKWGFQWEDIQRRGVDIMIAIDVSNSMLAEDVPPNRLEWAKRKITDLLSLMEGDRIGLIAFAGTAFIQCPLTLDYGAFRMFLDYLDTEIIPVQGTAIGDAITKGINAFGQDNQHAKAIILITDGEDHESDPLGAAKVAKQKGIRIFSIGIGKKEGTPIPTKDGLMKDDQGNLILTQMDETTLQKISLTTGGSYVQSVTGDLDIKRIYTTEIRGSMEQSLLTSTRQKKWEERFQIFLFLALLFIVAEYLLNHKTKHPRAIPIVVVAFAGMLWTPDLHASLRRSIQKGNEYFKEKSYPKALETYTEAQIDTPDNLKLQFNIANTHYKMGNYEAAVKGFTNVARGSDSDLAQKALYNLGNTMVQQGKLTEAVTFYKKSLALNPDDADAKHNLEYVRNEIKKRLEDAKKRPQKPNSPDNNHALQDNKSMKQSPKTEAPSPKNTPPAPQKDQTAQDRNAQNPKADDDSKADQSPAQAAAKPNQDSTNTGDDGNTPTAPGKEATVEMTKEAAQQWLDSLTEDQKKAIKYRFKNKGQGRHRVRKAW